ncbi:septation protein SepH [Streptosporangium sp. NBC_01755]|uniref:septation protein SepH n=1 Tax=Streptosporangium sp. NBC_01755 TaxID=2975949 RepID=UPI002DD9CFCB|nr:septation protein SepH [Streptosporangium sp. NBC_01755]WSD01082.1 septation protein SepH [Streptosporangium sp. NBC_01755]
MQELRLVAVSEDGTYLVLATAGRGTRFTLPVDDRLRAAVRGNFSRLGQYEIEVESPLRPKEIQARIRAGETAEEIANTAGIPVERVRWFEGPVLQEREYMAQQAQRCAVRLPGDSAPGPTLGDLVAERLTRRGVPADEIEWDSAKRDDNMWRIKLGFVWNGHTRNAEWLFDPRRRHITPHDDEALRLSSGEDVNPVEDTTVTPFVPRVAKLAPVPPLAPEPPNQQPVAFPSVLRHEPAAQHRPAYQQPPMPPLPAGYEAPRVSVPPLRAPDPAGYQPGRIPEPTVPAAEDSDPAAWIRPPEPVSPEPVTVHEPLPSPEPEPAAPAAPQPVAAVQPPVTAAGPSWESSPVGPPSAGAPEPAPATAREPVTGSGVPEQVATEPALAHVPAAPPEPMAAVATAEPVATEVAKAPEVTKTPEVTKAHKGAEVFEVAEVSEPSRPTAAPPPEPVPAAVLSKPAEQRSTPGGKAAEQRDSTKAENGTAAKETPAPETEPAQEGSIAVPAARVSVDERAKAEPGRQETQGDTGAMQETKVDKPAAEKPAEPPKPAPAPARPAKKSRGRRASVPTWDEIMFGARRQD